MAWQQVESYSFGFSPITKKFWLYYSLKGVPAVTQVFLTPTQSSCCRRSNTDPLRRSRSDPPG